MAKSRQSKRDADVLQVQGDGLKFGISTTGINETLRALRRMEKDTYDALRKEMVDEAKPLAKVVGDAFPKVKPLERWHTSGRKGRSRMPGYSPGLVAKGVKPVAGTGLARSGGQRILRIQQMNGGGQVYDTAGSLTARQLVTNLDKHLRVKSKQQGFRSRVMFRAVKTNFALVEEGVQRVIDKLEKQTERRLSEGIGGIY
jgi:hypothetical protein